MPTPPAGQRLRLLQWNIGNFDVRLHPLGGGPRGMRYSYASASREEDISDLAEVLRREAADIVTLQEVVAKSGHHARLAESAGYAVAAAGNPEERHTQVILVRRGMTYSAAPAPLGFRGVSARVSLESGRTVLVVSTHSSAGRFTEERAAQHRALAAWVRTAGRAEPLIIGGDFNFDDAPQSMHGMLQRLSTLIPGFPQLAASDWSQDRASLSALREILQDI